MSISVELPRNGFSDTQGTGQVSRHQAGVRIGSFQGGFFGDADERLTGDAHQINSLMVDQGRLVWRQVQFLADAVLDDAEIARVADKIQRVGVDGQHRRAVVGSGKEFFVGPVEVIDVIALHVALVAAVRAGRCAASIHPCRRAGRPAGWASGFSQPAPRGRACTFPVRHLAG